MPNVYFPTEDTRISNAFLATLGAAPGATYLAQAKSYGLGNAVNLMMQATGQTTASGLATVIASNLGLTGAAATAGQAYLTSVTFAGSQANWAANLLATLDLFCSAGVQADAVYGAAATAYVNRVNTAAIYSADPQHTSTDLAILRAAVGAPDTSTFTLTTSMDVAASNLFTSNRALVPGTGYVNTLDDEDILTGTGTNPTLNVAFGAENDISDAANVQPTLNNIQTVNVEWQANDTTVLNLADADGALSTVNLTRITATNAAITVEDMGASVRNVSVNDATRNGNVTLDWREEVLTATNETLAVGLSNARLKSLTLQEGGDGFADQGQYFETINVTSSRGNNDIDNMNVQGNGREDLLLAQTADTTKQALNFTVSAGTLEINDLQAPGVDTMNISVAAGTRLDIALDKAVALDAGNDGIATPDLEYVKISGAGGVMIDGLDTTEQDKAATPTNAFTASRNILTVDASTHTGGLKLGVASGADANVTDSGLAGTLRTTDTDLRVTSGSGDDQIAVYSNLAGSITTNGGNDTVTLSDHDMEGMSVISTGDGNDTVTARDLLSYGDLIADLSNSGDDSAASISTGAGNDIITVRNMTSAVNWDDNNPSDANADDLYAMVGASISAGDGTDTLTISGAMDENTRVDMGNDNDTVNYTLKDLTSVLADDTNSAREVLSVNSATATPETTTIDKDGAVIDLGAGNDTIVFTDIDTGESALTLILAGTAVSGAGAKLMGGTGTGDILRLITTDVTTVVSAATLANDTPMITGVERIDLIIENAVDALTTTATGVAATDANDVTTDTTVTLDVERVDTSLSQINLESREQTLRTLTGSERYESGQNTGFTLNNMRTGVTLNLSAFDATAVTGATNAANGTAIGTYADDGAINLYAATSNIDLQGDVALTMNFDLADSSSNADTFTLRLTDGSYGANDPRTAARAGFDLDLTMGATALTQNWTTSTSPTDDNDLVIENLNLVLNDSDSHLINLNGFGDAQHTETRANQVNAVATSLIVTGSAVGANIDLYDVTADTITANIAANVDIYVGHLSNKYTITTGTGNDNVHMGNDLVTPNLTTVTGDESDTINLGLGTDRLVISGANSLLSTGTAAVEPDAFAQISGVEILRIDANFGVGDANQITMDETAAATGINTVEITGDGAQDTGITLSENFNTDLTVLSAVMGINATTNLAALDADGNNRYTPRANEATRLTFDIQDVILDSDVVNTNITLGLDKGSQLTFMDAGLEQATLAVNVIVATAGATTIHGGMTGINNGTGPTFVNGTALNTNPDPYNVVNGTLRIVNQDSAASIDSITLLENETNNENGITLVVDNSWSIGATKMLTINAGGLLNTDTDVATGGLTLDGSMELDGKLSITGTANNDIIWGGNGNDTITGGAGADTLVGDAAGLVVVDGIQQQSTLTFADDTTAELGDTYSVTIGTDTIVYRIGEFAYRLNGNVTGYQGSAIATTIDQLKTWLAATFNTLNADVNLTTAVTVDPNANVITVDGIKVGANNDGGNSALGQTITVNASATNTVAGVAEVISINLNGQANEDYNAGETVRFTYDFDGAGGAPAVDIDYLVGTGSPLGTIVSDAIVATGLAALIDLDPNWVATASNGVITVTAAATGVSNLYANSSVSVLGESAYAKQYRYDISALSEANGTQITVTVNGNTWTSAAYSDNGGNDGTQETIDLTNFLGDPDGLGAATNLQTFLRTQLNNANIVVAASDADTFTITGASGASAADFTGPSFNLLNTGGVVTVTLTQVAADRTATTIGKAGLAADDIRLETLGTAAGAEPNAAVVAATTRAAVAAQIGLASNDVYVYGANVTDSSVTSGGAAAAGWDVVTVTAGDKFDFSAAVASVVSPPVVSGVVINLASGNAFLAQLNTAFTAADNNAADIEAAVIVFAGGERVLVVDANADQTINANDYVIQLVGTVTSLTLTGGDVVIA